jgi:hypothetical protein
MMLDDSPGSKRRLVFFTYLPVAVTLTAVSVLFNLMSLARVRLIHPEYPTRVIMGPYNPLEPVLFFHSLGTAGLAIVLLVFVASATMLIRTSKGFAFPLFLLAIASHLVFLLFSIVAYGFCLFRISGFFSSF